MPSGTAVSASAELCSASPSSATEPDSATTTACASAVAASPASEIHRARSPSAEDSSTGSTARSCVVGVRPDRVPQARPEPAVIVLVRVCVLVVVPWSWSCSWPLIFPA